MEIKQVPLSEIATIKGLIGGPFGSSLVNNDYMPIGVPVIRGTNLGYGKYLGGEFAYVSNAKVAQDLARNIAIVGDVVFTQRGTLGQVAIVPASAFEQYVISQSQMRLRVNSSVAVSEYVYYACSSALFQKQVADNAISTGVPHINLGIVNRLTIPLPAVSEQQAIAEVLGAIDDKIAANTNLMETSADLAMALFEQSLTEHSMKKPLVEVTALLSRGITPVYTEELADSMMILNQKCVRGQRVDLGPGRRTRLAKVRSEKILLPEDVVINSTGQGTLGRVARWSGPDEITVDSHITIVRFDGTKVDPTCGGFALMALQSEIEAMGEGSTGQTELSRIELGKLLVTLPSYESSLALGKQLRSMMEVENAKAAENRTLAATRDALLPQLMSGKLRVCDAEKAVEAVV